ncbi:MAG: adenosylcobinamide-phosphate guanylyltransferase, partial [Gammaproteobacteria bacterium]|nr:adenosylcobinamide-phosphate guanylyltransferase [Gammaproteobacteria bacterium]NIT64850.1 adenosylcobinamide-phosphate guanylyltransferase [Gammaproteobacteria bacterium]NIV20590.1 adenosylcobinamide-phosphate guanylyltransferase [Gammaproteobacteria bacterium]NIY33430.1 adenosylcobinamide-phosphate guanylyltransferase [Gammaproteobacteria bacterium]
SALRELPDADVVVVDCLTVWLSNLLLQESGSEALQAEVEALGRVVRDAA